MSRLPDGPCQLIESVVVVQHPILISETNPARAALPSGEKILITSVQIVKG